MVKVGDYVIGCNWPPGRGPIGYYGDQFFYGKVVDSIQGVMVQICTVKVLGSNIEELVFAAQLRKITKEEYLVMTVMSS